MAVRQQEIATVTVQIIINAPTASAGNPVPVSFAANAL
jgi:hypothetical protein